MLAIVTVTAFYNNYVIIGNNSDVRMLGLLLSPTAGGVVGAVVGCRR